MRQLLRMIKIAIKMIKAEIRDEWKTCKQIIKDEYK